MKPSERLASVVTVSLWPLIATLVASGWLLHGPFASGKGAMSPEATAGIRGDTAWKLLANAHYWGSGLLLVLSLLLVIVLLWSGQFSKDHRWGWWGALVVAAASFVLQVTGNLLPQDAHDVQTAMIETSIGAGVPFIGDDLRTVMLQGDTMSHATITVWYLAHRLIATGLLVLGMLFAGKSLIRTGIKSQRVLVWLPACAAAVLGAIASGPTGAPATPLDAHGYSASPAWYTALLHGQVYLAQTWFGHGWIGALLLPGLLGLFLMALPMLGKRIAINPVRIVLLFFAGAFAFGLMQSGASVAPIAGEQPVARATKLQPKSNEPEPIDAAMADRGKALFNRLPCVGCHGPDGRKSIAAPALTTIGRRHPDAEWFQKFIRNPRSVRPNSIMPEFSELSETDLRELAEFLRSNR